MLSIGYRKTLIKSSLPPEMDSGLTLCQYKLYCIVTEFSSGNAPCQNRSSSLLSKVGNPLFYKFTGSLIVNDFSNTRFLIDSKMYLKLLLDKLQNSEKPQ